MPLRPEDVVELKMKTFPTEVLDTFDFFIARNWNGHSSTVYQKEVETMICSKLDCKPKYLYDNDYMSVEPIYRSLGWKVEYDKPAYNESYPAKYIFRKK